nr:zinc finger, CCHC-type [Tanacetum cinerariifolium]
MFQQHQDESLYDAWTRFKNLIQRFPHHVLNLWSLAQFFYDHVDRYTKIDINYAAGGNLRRLSAEEAWETIKDAYDEPIGDMEDKVDNPIPQSTTQVLPSFEVYTPPVTYPEEVDETIGILMEVEPLDHTKLEDLGLNTCNHDIPLSSSEIPSVDEP